MAGFTDTGLNSFCIKRGEKSNHCLFLFFLAWEMAFISRLWVLRDDLLRLGAFMQTELDT